MKVMVNGEPRDLTDGVTASQLLEQLQISPGRVVVEVNLTILKRAQLATTVLNEGDHVEIVHFVGGGSCRLQIADFRHQTEVCGLRSVV